MLDFYQSVICGETRVDTLYDSEKVLAFHHTKPSYTQRVIVIPKKKIKDFLSLDKSDYNILLEMMNVAQDIAKTFSLEEGVRIITNIGKFQDSPHFHLHIVQGNRTIK